jgi:hypothetical protein
MKLNKKKTLVIATYAGLKRALLFTVLLALVLLTHAAVISFNLMYPEQPLFILRTKRYTALKIYCISTCIPNYLTKMFLFLGLLAIS